MLYIKYVSEIEVFLKDSGGKLYFGCKGSKREENVTSQDSFLGREGRLGDWYFADGNRNIRMRGKVDLSPASGNLFTIKWKEMI